MLKTKMYVRCPADQENIYEPRVFVCGQIINIDEFKRTVSVKVHDPFGHLLFFEDLPKGIIELPLGSVDRCSFFIGSIVVYKGSSYKVLSCQNAKMIIISTISKTLMTRVLLRCQRLKL